MLGAVFNLSYVESTYILLQFDPYYNNSEKMQSNLNLCVFPVWKILDQNSFCMNSILFYLCKEIWANVINFTM